MCERLQLAPSQFVKLIIISQPKLRSVPHRRASLHGQAGNRRCVYFEDRLDNRTEAVVVCGRSRYLAF